MIWIPVLAGIGLLVASCSTSPEDRLSSLVPGLPISSRTTLLNSSGEELREYYETEGHSRVSEDFYWILQAFWNAAQEDREFLLPLMGRLGRVRDDLFKVPYGTKVAQDLASRSPETLDRIFSLEQEWDRLRSDSMTPDAEKIVQLLDIVEELEKMGYVPLQVVVLANVAQLETSQGNNEIAFDYFEEALRRSQSVGYLGMTCQTLGKLFALARKSGRVEEAWTYLDKMDQLATSAKLARHAARAESFRGTIALQEGRFSAAYLHLEEARDRIRRFKGGRLEIGSILELIGFFSELGNWTIVEGLIQEAEAIPIKVVKRDEWARMGKLRMAKAEALARSGQVEEALVTTTEILEELKPRPFPQYYTGAIIAQARHLLDLGQLEQAQRYAEVGLEHCIQYHMPFGERSSRLLLVEILQEQGRLGDAQTHMNELATDLADPTILLGSDIRDEALLNLRQIRMDRGDGPQMAEAVVRALIIVQRRITASPPSAHTYLDLQGFDEVRWFIHDLIATDPALGYEFDMAWRGLTEVAALGLALTPEDRFTDAASAVRGWLVARKGGHVQASFTNDDPHMVFLVKESEIVRWLRSADGVERRILDLSPEAMRGAVSAALAEISCPPKTEDGSLREEAREALRILALGLVPELVENAERLGDDEAPRRLMWISADDALTQIPFAVFDLSRNGGYRPLGNSVETVYLRFLGTGAGIASGQKSKKLVVGDPTVAPGLRRRYPGLVPLPGALKEGQAVAKAWGESTSLFGRSATKPAVLNHLAGARRFYVAAHHERDAATPYIRFLPLWADSLAGDISEAFIEAADILALELGGCEIVALAGCSSGAPHFEGTRFAPGFGDVFLDAGASSVCQTMWNIDDLREPQMGASGGWAQYSNMILSPEKVALDLDRRPEFEGHPYAWGGTLLATTVILDRKGN